MAHEKLEPEWLEDMDDDDAIFVIKGTGSMMRIYVDGKVLFFDAEGQQYAEGASPAFVLRNRLEEVIAEAGQLGFDEAMAMMEAEEMRRAGETVAEYIARINKEAAEERRRWEEAEKASTGETRGKGTPKKRG